MKPQHRLASLCLVLALLLLPTSAARAGAADLAGLENYVRQSMKEWQVPGLALAVVERGRVVFSQGFGLREVGKTGPVTPRTIFAIGSSTKAFTATALAMLVDEGRIKWDAPVMGYLPGFRLADPWVSAHISLRDLLSHRSGLKGQDILWVWRAGYLSRNQLVHRLRYEPLAFPFRSQWHYNNLMYLTAGQTLAAVAGKSWDEVIRQRIFTPLGMTNSNTSVRELKGLSNVASPHLTEGGKPVAISYRNVDSIAPAGAINSNLEDMTRWLRFQLAGCELKNRALLKKDTVRVMRSPQISMPIPYPVATVPGAHFLGYGLAWFLHDYHGVKLVEHGGNIDGMTALVAIIPERQSGLVILSNLNTTRLREVLMYHLCDRLLGRPPRDWNPHFLALAQKTQAGVEKAMADKRASRQKGTKPSLALEAYQGRYHNPLFGPISIELEHGRLVFSYQGRSVALTHWQHDSFKRPNWSVEEPGIELVGFGLGPDGKPAWLQDDTMGKFVKAAKP